MRTLLSVRGATILAFTLLFFFALSHDTEQAPGDNFLIALGGMMLITVCSMLRLAVNWRITPSEIGVQLLIDVAGISILLYFSGGAFNPLLVLVLSPVSLAARRLPKAAARGITTAAIALAAGLTVFFQPLPYLGVSEAGVLQYTAWAALGLCAITLGWFVTELPPVGQPSPSVDAGQGNGLDPGYVSSVARLAAGTANELNAPIATMSALVEELAEHADKPQQREDFSLLAEQLEQCSTVLEQLSRTARVNEDGQKRWVDLIGFAESTLNNWLGQRSEAVAEVTVSGGDGNDEPPRLQVDVALAYALEHLLNNAADEQPRGIRFDVSWDTDWAYLRIDDKGPGFPPRMLENRSSTVVSAGKKGLGVGLLVAQATAARYGGRLELANRKIGGASARLCLPLDNTQEQK